MNQKEFKEQLHLLGIDLSIQQENQLEKFYEFLIQKNCVMNLTRITKKEDVYLKHFYDSLSIVKAINMNEIKTLCDVGSGAGFPGIVLKIVFPHLEIVLLDALQKRVNYLNECIHFLKLDHIEAIHLRGEEYHQKQFDLVVARAVAPLDKLLPICIPLVKKHGVFLAMKANVDEELEGVRKMMKKKNIILTKEISFYLPTEESKRTLLSFIQK